MLILFLFYFSFGLRRFPDWREKLKCPSDTAKLGRKKAGSNFFLDFRSDLLRQRGGFCDKSGERCHSCRMTGEKLPSPLSKTLPQLSAQQKQDTVERVPFASKIPTQFERGFFIGRLLDDGLVFLL